jgi:hypothetical protein
MVKCKVKMGQILRELAANRSLFDRYQSKGRCNFETPKRGTQRFSWLVMLRVGGETCPQG